jgi:hypothetical protein
MEFLYFRDFLNSVFARQLRGETGMGWRSGETAVIINGHHVSTQFLVLPLYNILLLYNTSITNFLTNALIFRKRSFVYLKCFFQVKTTSWLYLYDHICMATRLTVTLVHTTEQFCRRVCVSDGCNEPIRARKYRSRFSEMNDSMCLLHIICLVPVWTRLYIWKVYYACVCNYANTCTCTGPTVGSTTTV